MLLFYILLIVYVLAINFYSFMYIFALHKAQMQGDLPEQGAENTSLEEHRADLSVADVHSDEGEEPQEQPRKKREKPKKPSLVKAFAVKPVKGFDWKLMLCSALGGAITIYVCMFVFRYKLNNLFLMIVTPILAAANGYLWFLLLSSRFFMGR